MRLEDKTFMVGGSLMFASNRHGDIDRSLAEPRGLFWYDTRLLSRYGLRINGQVPDLIASHQEAPDLRWYGLTLTDTQEAGLFQHPRHFVYIRRTQLITDVFTDHLRIFSYVERPLELDIRLEWAVDFADVSELRQHGLRGAPRRRRVALHRRRNALAFSYRGTDRTTFCCDIRLNSPPVSLHKHGCKLTCRLLPGESMDIQIEVRPTTDEKTRRGDRGIKPLRRKLQRRSMERRAWLGAGSEIVTGNPEMNRYIRRSLEEIRALILPVSGRRIISAGVPLFHAAFGRDMLLTAFAMLPFQPDLAREVLAFLARHQGTRVDPFKEEEPGKILHELRVGELARSGAVPHHPYYGSTDVTLLFVILLHEYHLWTGDLDFVTSLLPALRLALHWAEHNGDSDGDGWIEYDAVPGRGLVHKGWKDSRDSITDKRGRPPVPPIRLVEIQGYWTDAMERAADLFDLLGETAQAHRLRRRAVHLRSRIERAFRLRRPGHFAIALDGRHNQIPLLTSNPGHLLFSGAVSRSTARDIRNTLFSHALYSGWGIRTLSDREPTYHPLHYHRGTLWPHDNMIIAFGLGRYGMTRDAARLWIDLFRAAQGLPEGRLPELFAGFDRTTDRSPIAYPVACSPQAWSSASVFMLLRSAIGLFPDVPRKRVHLKRTHLPDWIRFVRIERMPLGEGRYSLFLRAGERGVASRLERLSGPALRLVRS